MAVHESQIRESIERYGKAMSSGDLVSISSCWEVPAIVLADDGAVAMADKDQIERFFAHAIEWYQSRGLMATRPEIERAEALTERLTSVDVRWPSFDEADVERASERSHYVLRLGEDGQQRIQVAITEPLSHPD